jgi:hypothetical protein
MPEERRLHKRESFTEMVQYVPYPPSSTKLLTGQLRDFCYSGLCIVTSEPLVEGQEVLVEGIATPNVRTAVVRWYQKVDKDTFRVGLQFK